MKSRLLILCFAMMALLSCQNMPRSNPHYLSANIISASHKIIKNGITLDSSATNLDSARIVISKMDTIRISEDTIFIKVQNQLKSKYAGFHFTQFGDSLGLTLLGWFNYDFSFDTLPIYYINANIEGNYNDIHLTYFEYIMYKNGQEWVRLQEMFKDSTFYNIYNSVDSVIEDRYQLEYK